MIGVLRELGASTLARDVNEVVRALVLNVLIGNAEAHGKNYSILYDPVGVGQLAPLYDLVATRAYPELSRSLAMTIGGVDNPDEVDVDSWRRLAADASLGGQLPRAVQAFARRVVAGALATREAARDEGWHRPVLDEIVDLATRRAARFER